MSGRVRAAPGSAIPEGMQAEAAASGPEKIDLSKVIAMRKQRGGKNPDGLKVSYVSGYANMDDERSRR